VICLSRDIGGIPMKKHRYSAKNIKQADWKQIVGGTAGRRVVFGVDVAKEDFFGVLMQEDLGVIATLKWRHPEQTRALGAHLIEELHADRLEVAMEPSGTYGDALYGYLSGLGLPISTGSVRNGFTTPLRCMTASRACTMPNLRTSSRGCTSMVAAVCGRRSPRSAVTDKR